MPPLEATHEGTKKPAASLLRRIIERPQQVFLRKAVFQVHLWAGILLAVYVIAIGVSGSILVFKEELMPKPRVRVGYVDYKACTAAKLMQAIAAANTAVPEMKAFLASCPTPANPLYTVMVRAVPQRPAGPPIQAAPGGGPRGRKLPQRAVYLDPHTLAVLGDADRESSWVEAVEQFHVNLLLGRGGRLWNGIGASVLLVITLSGLVLWWPGSKNWTRGLKVNFRRSWKRINFDLHSAMGIWTVFFTLTWALTGMYFTWPKIFTTPIKRVSHFETANYPGDQLKEAQAKLRPADIPEARPSRSGGDAAPGPSTADRTMQPHAETSVDVASMIASAQRESPDGHLEGVFYGVGPKAIFTVYMARGILGDYSNTDFVYLDQHTGRLLHTWHRGQNHTLADWYVWLIAPLHFGTSFGQTFKVLWAVMGLALPALTITGLLMYWNRWLSKRLRRASS